MGNPRTICDLSSQLAGTYLLCPGVLGSVPGAEGNWRCSLELFSRTLSCQQWRPPGL